MFKLFAKAKPKPPAELAYCMVYIDDDIFEVSGPFPSYVAAYRELHLTDDPSKGRINKLWPAIEND